jgi:arylsulfatase A-like enzyme
VTLGPNRAKRNPLVVLLACAGAAAAACAREPRPSGPPSVLLVTIDTLRADRVGAYGDEAARTPRLDRLAQEGVLFEQAFTPVPLTLPAHATLLTGLLPPRHGVRGNGSFALGREPLTLAEAMKRRGLATAAFVGAFPVARRFGLGRGFDVYDDAFERAPGLHFDFAERRADRVVEAASAWLTRTPGPAFLWVHLYDPHAPYDPPEGYRGSDPYRGEIAFADAMLDRLLGTWDGRPGPSVVAVTSDHGEAFGEHGEESHGLFVYDTTLRVPLLLRGGGLPKARRVPARVSIADLPATLADLAGAEAPAGSSLVRVAASSTTPSSAPLYAETLAPRLDFGWSELRSWRDGKFKYVRAPRPELYDLDADPAETRNLAGSSPEVAARLSSALDSALAGMGDAESRRGPDPEAVERLRALGYVQGPEARGSGADPKDRLEVARLIAKAVGPFETPQQLIAAYAEIARLDPDNPLVSFRLADALLRSGRARDAVPLFRKVVASGPRSPDPYVGLATALAQLGRVDQAKQALEQALGVDATSGQAHFNLGEIARMRGDAAGARAHYDAARADPATRERAEARLASLRAEAKR